MPNIQSSALSVKDFTPDHLGRRFRVVDGPRTVEGVLTEYKFSCDMVADDRYFSPTLYVKASHQCTFVVGGVTFYGLGTPNAPGSIVEVSA